MFATSTKTATFLLTLTPWIQGFARPARSRSSAGRSCCPTRGGTRRDDGSLDTRTGFSEAHPLPAGKGCRVVRPLGLDHATALVAGRSKQLLEECLGDAVGIVFGIDDQEVDRADVPPGPDGRSEREDPATDHEAPYLRDDDARLRHVDQLAHEIGRPEWTVATVRADRVVTQGDDAIDVRDTGCSDQVFHVDGSNLAGLGDPG